MDKKYYKKVFFHLIDLALWNSYILYNVKVTEAGKKALAHLKFHMQIIQDIVAVYGADLQSTKVVGRPLTSPGCLHFTP